MNIVAVLGSPHSSGNGAAALDSILKGAKKRGASCKKYVLCSLDIKNCLGCRKCIENGGCCVR